MPKPKNDQNTPETLKMAKITPKPKNWPKYTQNPKNDQNTPETQKMTKIPPKPKYPKNDQNTPKT